MCCQMIITFRIKGGGTAKTLQGDVSVAGDLIIDEW